MCAICGSNTVEMCSMDLRGRWGGAQVVFSSLGEETQKMSCGSASQESPYSCDSSVPVRVVGFSTPGPRVLQRPPIDVSRGLIQPEEGRNQVGEEVEVHPGEEDTSSAFWAHAQGQEIPEERTLSGIQRQESQLSQQLSQQLQRFAAIEDDSASAFDMQKSKLKPLSVHGSRDVGADTGSDPLSRSLSSCMENRRRPNTKQMRRENAARDGMLDAGNHGIVAGTLQTQFSAQRKGFEGVKDEPKSEKKARRYSPKGCERNTHALPIPKLSRAWTAPEPLPELTASMVERILDKEFNTPDEEQKQIQVKEKRRSPRDVPTAEFLDNVAALKDVHGEAAERKQQSQDLFKGAYGNEERLQHQTSRLNSKKMDYGLWR